MGWSGVWVGGARAWVGTAGRRAGVGGAKTKVKRGVLVFGALEQTDRESCCFFSVRAGQVGFGHREVY